MLLPKRDCPLRECEDALAADVRGLRFAVADGATEGLDSRRWARLLVRAWTSPSMRGTAADDAGELVACARGIGDRVRARWEGRTLPWYLDDKARLGAFAAFVGVALDDDARAFEAVALGDSCLFVLEGGRIAASFPLTDAEQFRASPTLLPSNHARFADVSPLVRTLRADLAPGATLLLLSDAISAWYLADAARDGAGARRLHALLDRDDAAGVAALVAEERAARRMRNDDVAVLRIARTDR